MSNHYYLASFIVCLQLIIFTLFFCISTIQSTPTRSQPITPESSWEESNSLSETLSKVNHLSTSESSSSPPTTQPTQPHHRYHHYRNLSSEFVHHLQSTFGPALNYTETEANCLWGTGLSNCALNWTRIGEHAPDWLTISQSDHSPSSNQVALKTSAFSVYFFEPNQSQQGTSSSAATAAVWMAPGAAMLLRTRTRPLMLPRVRMVWATAPAQFLLTLSEHPPHYVLLWFTESDLYRMHFELSSLHNLVYPF